MHGRLSFDNQTPWAVRPEALNAIARMLAMGEDEIRAEIATRAATPRAQNGGGVAVIPLRGVITPRPSLISMLFGGGSLEGFRSDLRAALSSDDVGSILIDIDSPGGSTALLTETAAEIRAARRSKPVVAIANTTAASAAYWLGSQADEMVVTPSGEVGSIGVFAMHEDWSKFDEKLGVATTLISAGKFKTEGNPSEPLSDDAREAVQQTINEFYGQFLADVAKGRGVTAPQVRDGFGEGRMVTAKRAVELGMVDRVESYERTVARLVAGPSETRRDDTAEALAAAAATEELHRAETPTPQPGDNPPPNEPEGSEEEAARIAALVTARPHHVP